jgi:hypothetical protein
VSFAGAAGTTQRILAARQRVRPAIRNVVTGEEEACFASGRWPLLRVPCGALLIGECAFGVSRLEEVNGSDIISVQHHDRNAVVLVPPGNYAVNILQYLTGPNFCFHLTPASDEPPCPMNMALTLHESVPLKLQDRVVGAWQTDQPGAVRPAHLCGSDPVAVRNWGLSYLEPIFDCRESIPRLQVRLS